MVPGIHGLISSLYCRGADLAPERYRRWALNELRGLIDFDAALWGSGTVQRPHFHNVTVIGLPSAFARALEDTQQLNPLLPLIRENLGHPLDMADVVPDEEFFASELYRRAFQPFGVERILSSAHIEPRSGLYTLLSIYRFDRNRPFSDEEKRIQDQLLYHLIQAAAHAFFLTISRPPQSDRRVFNAVCDSEGVFHEVERGFLDLLDQHLEDWPGQRLPFPLPDPGAGEVLGELHISVEPLEDRFLVHLRDAGPLDLLTDRERDVVTQVCQGLSAKAIGRELGLAASTVSTHLYRAYRKLGVENRTALARLMQSLQ